MVFRLGKVSYGRSPSGVKTPEHGSGESARLKPCPDRHELSTRVEDIAGPARNELLRFSRHAHRRAEQRARRRVRMLNASRMRSPAQRTGITLRPAAIFEQRYSVRNGEDLRVGTDQSESIGAGFVAAALRPPAFWGPAEARANVHTQRFAFRAPEEDDESVKMSNITNGRASTVTPGLRAVYPRLKRQVLFSTNERFSPAANSATNRKQSTSLFLFNTNEAPPITTHHSLITNHGDSKWPKN